MKKLTYIVKIILFFFIVFLLYIASSTCLIFAIHQSNISNTTKGVSYCLLLIIPLILILLFKSIVLIPLNHFKSLSVAFIQGHIYDEYVDAVSNLYPGFHEVLDHFDTILNDRRLNKETIKRSEFLALQNQINPHFLYNTLEAIRGDALSEGMDNIADITEALSTFFRYSVTDTGSLVTLADELENIDNYFKIQQYRFGEKMEIQYEIDEDDNILEFMCPKLTMQPIVENAIFHGLEKRLEKGSIRIRLERSDSKVLMSIIDNGVGMDNITLDELNHRLSHITITNSLQEENKKKGGIALINVCRRIKLLFGEQYGIHIYSIPEYGTDVRITLPIITKNQSGVFL